MKCFCLIFVKFKQLYDIQYFLGINIIWSIGIIQKWEGWVKVLWGMGVNESGFSTVYSVIQFIYAKMIYQVNMINRYTAKYT